MKSFIIGIIVMAIIVGVANRIVKRKMENEDYN